MNAIVAHLAKKAKTEPEKTEKAVGAILGFLRSHGDEAVVDRIIATIPGASDLAARVEVKPRGGILGSLLSNLGTAGGAMALAQQLMGDGLSMDQITALVKGVLKLARKHAGDEAVDEMIASVPGLAKVLA